MPLHEGQELSPDEAIARGLCPECARPLAETNPDEHGVEHWPRGATGEAARRLKLILEFQAAHPKPVLLKESV